MRKIILFLLLFVSAAASGSARRQIRVDLSAPGKPLAGRPVGVNLFMLMDHDRGERRARPMWKALRDLGVRSVRFNEGEYGDWYIFTHPDSVYLLTRPGAKLYPRLIDIKSRGIDGKLLAIRYAREHRLPFLGLCLGMQLAIVEFARNVAGYADAHSVELDPSTRHPVIHLMPEQNGIEDIGGTLRLGSYPCVLNPDSRAFELYGQEIVHERHRHRYEVNNDYREVLSQNGMLLSGMSPDRRIVEMIELPGHPWFVATQAHPEFKSRPNKPHPLFRGFIEAALKK